MKNRLIGVVVATLASIFLLAGTARSDEINVLAVIAVKEAYLELVPQFEKSSAHKIVTTWSGTADMMKRMKAGEAGAGREAVDWTMTRRQLERLIDEMS